MPAAQLMVATAEMPAAALPRAVLSNLSVGIVGAGIGGLVSQQSLRWAGKRTLTARRTNRQQRSVSPAEASSVSPSTSRRPRLARSEQESK